MTEWGQNASMRRLVFALGGALRKERVSVVLRGFWPAMCEQKEATR